MATFTMRMSLQYLNSSGTPGFDNDGEVVVCPAGIDYVGDVPNSNPVSHPVMWQLGVMATQTSFYNPSPFTLIREIDPNQFPATRSAFNPAFN